MKRNYNPTMMSDSIINNTRCSRENETFHTTTQQLIIQRRNKKRQRCCNDNVSNNYSNNIIPRNSILFILLLSYSKIYSIESTSTLSKSAFLYSLQQQEYPCHFMNYQCCTFQTEQINMMCYCHLDDYYNCLLLLRGGGEVSGGSADNDNINNYNTKDDVTFDDELDSYIDTLIAELDEIIEDDIDTMKNTINVSTTTNLIHKNNNNHDIIPTKTTITISDLVLPSNTKTTNANTAFNNINNGTIAMTQQYNNVIHDELNSNTNTLIQEDVKDINIKKSASTVDSSTTIRNNDVINQRKADGKKKKLKKKMSSSSKVNVIKKSKNKQQLQEEMKTSDTIIISKKKKKTDNINKEVKSTTKISTTKKNKTKVETMKQQSVGATTQPTKTTSSTSMLSAKSSSLELLPSRPPLLIPPPNAIYRFLLRSGYIGRVIVLNIIALIEFIKTYIPPLFTILDMLGDRLGLKPPIPSYPASPDRQSSSSSSYTSTSSSLSQRSGQSKKQRQSILRQVDEYAVKQLQRIGTIHKAKYRLLSDTFMKRHYLGSYVSTTTMESNNMKLNDADELNTNNQQQASKSSDSLFDKIVPFASSKKTKILFNDDKKMIDMDWVIKAMTQPGRNINNDRHIDWSKTNEGIIQMIKSNKYNNGVKKSIITSISESSDNSNSLVGRSLRAVSGTSLSRSLLGAYPGDAVPINDAASANGIVPLAYKYGYGEWSDDDENYDNYDDNDDNDFYGMYPNDDNDIDIDNDDFGTIPTYYDDIQNEKRNINPNHKKTLKKRIVKKKKKKIRRKKDSSSKSSPMNRSTNVSKGGAISSEDKDKQNDIKQNPSKQQDSGFYMSAESGNISNNKVRIGYNFGYVEVGINLGSSTSSSRRHRNSSTRPKSSSFSRDRSSRSSTNQQSKNNNNTPKSNTILRPPKSTIDQLHNKINNNRQNDSYRRPSPPIRKEWNHRQVIVKKKNEQE